MEVYNIIVLIFGLISFILLVLLYFINRILQYKIKINNAFSAVRVLLINKVKIIDTMLEFINKNFPEEKSLYKSLSDTRKRLENVSNNKEGIEMIKRAEKDLLKIDSLENTYKKLGKNKNYNMIKKRLSNNRDELVYALDSYDVEVIKYNNYRKHKLIRILSKILFIPEYVCYSKLK